MKNRLLVLIILPILLVLSCTELDSEKVPLQFEKIAIYPGAVRDVKAEEYVRSKNKGRYKVQITEVYRTNAPIEEVSKFYLKKFGFKTDEIYLCTAIPYKTASGIKPYVACMMNFYAFDELEGHSDSKETNEYKTALAKVRKPYKPNKWLSYVSFIWGPIHTRYTLEIKDYGSFKGKNKYHSQTAICITGIGTNIK